jgi:chemotaxis protein MotB
VKTSNRDRWLVSYADFITLLFAFFTTMYAISTVDQNKLAGVAEGLQQALNAEAFAGAHGRGAGPTPLVGRGDVRDGGGMALSEGLNVRRAVLAALGADIDAHRVEIHDDPRGLVLSIPEASAFAAGSADMSTAADSVVDRFAAALTPLRTPVRVEGHTDDTPIHTARFASNWELSTARATSVVQRLISVVQRLIAAGIAPERLSAAGYSEFHPRVANDSPESRARNRRVDLVVLTAQTAAAEEPASKERP